MKILASLIVLLVTNVFAQSNEPIYETIKSEIYWNGCEPGLVNFIGAACSLPLRQSRQDYTQYDVEGMFFGKRRFIIDNTCLIDLAIDYYPDFSKYELGVMFYHMDKDGKPNNDEVSIIQAKNCLSYALLNEKLPNELKYVIRGWKKYDE